MGPHATFLALIGGALAMAGVVLARALERPKALAPLIALGAIALLQSVVLPLDHDAGWETDWQVARARAKAEAKPLVVDGWARWCASCLELAKITFPDPAVRDRLDAFVAVKLDMDADANQALWEDYDIPGLPWVAFFTPEGQIQPAHTLNAFEAPAAFAARLDRVRGLGGEATDGGSEAEDIAARLASRGLLLTLLFVFGAGFLVSLTPCVYPLIPITMTVIGARTTSSLAQRLALSLTFVGGIAITYTGLGLAAGLGGASLGAAMQNPWVTGAIGLLFLVMALSYLDLYTLQLPEGLQARLSGAGGAGYGGAMAMGLVAGLVAAPCAGPVTVAILAHIAQTRDPLLGVALMLAFSLGLGLLFVAIGTSTALTNRLPKSGLWMDVLKVAFAVVLFALGYYYASLALPALNAPFEWLAGLSPLA